MTPPAVAPTSHLHPSWHPVWCVPPLAGISCVLSGISGHYMLILRLKFAHFMPKVCPFYILATDENTQQGALLTH